jgi:hypothetical protein
MSETSRGRTIGYWISTGLTAFGMLAGGVFDVMAGPEVAAIMAGLGYPLYAAQFIGVAKVLAAITIVAPKFPRLKEWAYAGIAIDLLGASYSHAASGHAVKDIVMPLVIFAVAMVSWWLRPGDRKLPDPKA